jgi:hypothetical protein
VARSNDGARCGGGGSGQRAHRQPADAPRRLGGAARRLCRCGPRPDDSAGAARRLRRRGLDPARRGLDDSSGAARPQRLRRRSLDDSAGAALTLLPGATCPRVRVCVFSLSLSLYVCATVVVKPRIFIENPNPCTIAIVPGSVAIAYSTSQR